MNPRSSEAELLYRQALASCEQGQIESGIRLLQQALAIAPGEARISNLLGLALSRLGRHDEALVNLDRAIAVGPATAKMFGNRSDVLVALGRFVEAVDCYDRALALAPNSVEDWCNKGALLHDLKRHREALDCFDRAIRLAPDFASGHLNRGVVLSALGSYVEAVSSFDRAIALEPGLVAAHIGRGKELAALGSCEQAIESFDRAIALQPVLVDAHYGRAKMLERLGRTKEALAAVYRVLEIDSRHCPALVSQAVLLAELGHSHDALASCDRALAVRGDDPQVLALRTDILVGLGLFDEAVQSHEKFIATSGAEQSVAPPIPLDRHALKALLGQTDDRSIVCVPWTQGATLLAHCSGDSQGRLAAIVLQGLETLSANRGEWPRLRAALFAAGYIPLRQPLAESDGPNTIYVRSDLLLDVSAAGVVTGPAIGMWNLGNNGRFANQLWQYLFISMYGLRNGLVVECPPWDGEEYFGFKNPRPRPRPTREYHSFSEDHLELWKSDSPPQNINFSGYFQEVPDVWRAHRLFIRRFFTLKRQWRTAFDNFHDLLRSENRTLVSIHIRRGDYVTLFKAGKSHFRPVPTSWYRAALSKLWPQLQAPVLHVATDEPQLIGEFSDYPQLGDRFVDFSSDVPAHVRDFVALQDSQWLLACNSSYSMMAALLAREDQNCLLVDFKSEAFVRFDFWSEGRFWNRFV